MEAAREKTKKRGAWKKLRQEGYLEVYLMLLPGLLLLLIFRYLPMGGLIIAFQDFNIFEGIGGSEFVGLANFRRVFENPDFYKVLWNTIFINVYKLCFYIPLPIIVAIMLEEIRMRRFKATVQTVIYLPHFLSWIIVGGLFANLLATNTGLVNSVLESMGLESVKFMYDPAVFPSVIVFSSMWKEIGWGAIVYLGALTAIDPQLYEAAKIDGASRIKQIFNITLPGIAGTFVVVTLTNLAGLLTNSFEQILVMYNPAVYDVADVISTYVYRYGIGQMEYGYSTAIGLFNSLVGFILIMSFNTFCKKRLDRGVL